MMEWIIIGLLSLSVLLFILSFLQKDPYKELEKQIEMNSVQSMQEIYYLKKRIEYLETAASEKSEEIQKPVTRDDILVMLEDGSSMKDIAEISELEIKEIENLLDSSDSTLRGQAT